MLLVEVNSQPAIQSVVHDSDMPPHHSAPAVTALVQRKKWDVIPPMGLSDEPDAWRTLFWTTELEEVLPSLWDFKGVPVWWVQPPSKSVHPNEELRACLEVPGGRLARP